MRTNNRLRSFVPLITFDRSLPFINTFMIMNVESYINSKSSAFCQSVFYSIVSLTGRPNLTFFGKQFLSLRGESHIAKKSLKIHWSPVLLRGTVCYKFYLPCVIGRTIDSSNSEKWTNYCNVLSCIQMGLVRSGRFKLCRPKSAQNRLWRLGHLCVCGVKVSIDNLDAHVCQKI